MDAYLVDAVGRPITDAKVSFDTDMTNMSHGLSLTPALSAGNGYYRGQVHFSMPGPWRVIALVERPGQETVGDMMVEIATAKLTSEYHGALMYFYAAGCKRAFDKDPVRYLVQSLHQNKAPDPVKK